MKKLKMVVSAIIVFVTVGSALAFKGNPFGGAFCASIIGPNINCHVITNVTENGGSIMLWKDPKWNGTAAGCHPNYCPTPSTLKSE